MGKAKLANPREQANYLRFPIQIGTICCSQVYQSVFFKFFLELKAI